MTADSLRLQISEGDSTHAAAEACMAMLTFIAALISHAGMSHTKCVALWWCAVSPSAHADDLLT